MDNFYTAISLSLIANQRFAINCQNVSSTIDLIKHYILEPLSLSYIDINVQRVLSSTPGEISLLLPSDEEVVTIWRNVDKLSDGDQKHLVGILNKVDDYDTNESKLKRPRNGSPKTLIMVTEDNNKIIQHLKYKFWFCQYYTRHSLIKAPEDLVLDGKYLQTIAELQDLKVFVAPDIQRYIYSLIVHSRNHRLCLVSPMKTRLPTFSIKSVELLSQTYVKWTSLKQANSSKRQLFVTPDVCKIAMRKVSYWLINWQADGVNTQCDDEEEHAEMLRFALLAGDWYGSDWKYIKKYISKAEESGRNEFNIIVEDSLEKVQPPL